MAENKIYLAIGEEAVRGVKESSAVGFIPLLKPGIPKLEFDDKKRSEFRGEDSVKGETAVRRMGQKWHTSLEMPFFTESGGVKGMSGALLKHFFGKAVSSPCAAPGLFSHMMHPVADPFSAANLASKALTLNFNVNEGPVMKNWPFTGGRVKSLAFAQEAGQQLKLTAEMFGQFRDASTPEIGAPVFAAETLRCDYNELAVYSGKVSRTGAAPDFTDFAAPGAVPVKPDKLSVKFENGMEDHLRLSGSAYPDKTRMGRYKVTFEMTIDWEDPASGFSSVAEFNGWLASPGSSSFLLCWDAGAGHALYIDLPQLHRAGGEPNYNLAKDPMITLKYEGLYDSAVTKYIAGVMLKNTAAAI